VRTERIGFLDKHVFWGIAFISLAFLTVALVPFVGSFVIVLVPLPVMFFLEKLGRLRGFTVLTISLLIEDVVLRLFSAEGDISFFLLLSYVGIVIHEILKKSLTIERTVLLSVLAGAGLSLIMLLFQSALLGQMPWTLVADYITKSFQESIELSAQMGAQGEQIKFIKDNLPIITRSLLYVFPALTLVGLSFVIWLNLIIARKLFTANGLPYPDFGELIRWKAPEITVWFFIAAGTIVLIPPVLGFKILEMFIPGLNILIVCCFVYFLQGLAVFEYYFKTRQVPRMLRFLFYFFLMLQQYLILLVVSAGLFDLWLDFRKLNPKPLEPEEE